MVWMISVLPSHKLHILHIYCTSLQGDTVVWMISVRPSHILHITTGWHNGLNDLSATFTYIAGWHKGRNDLSATFTYIAHHCRVTQGSEWSQCYLRIHCASLQGNTMAWMISVLYTTHILHITAGWHNGLSDLSATFAYIAHHCRVTQWPEWSQCYLRIYCTSLQGDTVAWMIPVLPSHISHITTGWHNAYPDHPISPQSSSPAPQSWGEPHSPVSVGRLILS